MGYSVEVLAGKVCLPKLIFGKVCIMLTNDEYELIKVSKHTIIEDDFNPLHYGVLISDKYSRCIVYTSHKQQEQALVNKYWNEYKKKMLKK